MADAKPSPHRALRRQMLLVLLLFGLLPLLLAGAVVFATGQREGEQRTRNLLEAMVKNRKATVDLFLEQTMRELELTATMLPVARLARPEVLEALREEMRRERGGIVDLGLISEEGRHLAYVGPYRLEGQDYRRAPWFKEVMVRGRYESDVFLGFRQFPHMVMAVVKREGGRAYILRATIDIDLLSRLVREGGLESGAEVFVLNRAGEYQTQYSEAHRLMEPCDLGSVAPHSGTRVVLREQGGRREWVATTWLRGESWVLVARQAPPGLRAIANPAVAAVFLLGILLVPLLSVLVARHRLRQIRGLEADAASLLESAAQSQKMAAIGRLAASIAHEINNPLAIIDAQAGVLTDALADTPDFPLRGELQARLKKIGEQVDRGRKVTHRLLGFSRRVGPDEEPVDVAVALDETLGFVEKEAATSGIRIVRQYDPDVPIVRSSLSQMQQVFLNLVNNAMDAVGRGGEIRLVVRQAEGGVEVRVEDDGPGIPERDLARVFEPFYSTKPSSAPHSGLGLAICRDIMRDLGGRIGVTSQTGRGTSFELFFPLESGAAGSPAAHTPGEARGG